MLGKSVLERLQLQLFVVLEFGKGNKMSGVSFVRNNIMFLAILRFLLIELSA